MKALGVSLDIFKERANYVISAYSHSLSALNDGYSFDPTTAQRLVGADADDSCVYSTVINICDVSWTIHGARNLGYILGEKVMNIVAAWDEAIERRAGGYDCSRPMDSQQRRPLAAG